MHPVLDASSVPQLGGIFAPVQDELTDAPCTVIQGAIPGELVGTYVRNGPNPRFPPIGSYTYPFDGDGMVHAIRFAEGRATYRNRYVRTPTLVAEEKAGRALWGGVLRPISPSAEEVGPDLARKPFRDLPDINIVRHAGRLLALAEGDVPFALSDDLTTVGPWDFFGTLPAGMCAHPKIDPVSGEMVVFRYSLDAPFLSWALVGADGTVSRPPEAIEIDAAYMIHDCAITEHHLVILVCPLRIDLAADDVLAWEPQRGTRIAVIPRQGGGERILWFATEPFWVWHIANAYEAGRGTDSHIVLHYPHWSHPAFGEAPPATGGVHRMTLQLASGQVGIDELDDRLWCEFPRIDDRLSGRFHRYFHAVAKDPDLPPQQGVWDALLRYDLTTGKVAERRTGRLALGEAVFAPRPAARAAAEDAGYLLLYACDRDTLETRLLILNAADIEGEPAATLRMPRRVPLGLHGSWVPDRMIAGQALP